MKKKNFLQTPPPLLPVSRARPMVIRGPNTPALGQQETDTELRKKNIEYIFFKYLPSFLLSEPNRGKDMYNHKKRDIIS